MATAMQVTEEQAQLAGSKGAHSREEAPKGSPCAGEAVVSRARRCSHGVLRAQDLGDLGVDFRYIGGRR
jgi:hypothetical protein